MQVRRPRQLAAGSPDPFRDQTTMLDSEMLKFDLKPEVYGTGIPELPPAPAVGKEGNYGAFSLFEIDFLGEIRANFC